MTIPTMIRRLVTSMVNHDQWMTAWAGATTAAARIMSTSTALRAKVLLPYAEAGSGMLPGTGAKVPRPVPPPRHLCLAVAMSDVVVTHHPEESRYEAHIGGKLAGFAAYKIARGNQVFTHTEVDDAFEGQGVGGALARAALDDVRERGEHQVVALCPFIAAWIERHPDYQDLVAP